MAMQPEKRLRGILACDFLVEEDGFASWVQTHEFGEVEDLGVDDYPEVTLLVVL